MYVYVLEPHLLNRLFLDSFVDTSKGSSDSRYATAIKGSNGNFIVLTLNSENINFLELGLNDLQRYLMRYSDYRWSRYGSIPGKN